MSRPTALLVDARNFDELFPALLEKFSVPDQLNGFDLETEDSRRHPGLNAAMNVSEEGHKSAVKKLLFDVNRTTITGFSLYADQDNVAFYFNTAHADVENRIPKEKYLPLLQAIKDNGYFVAHKTPFELCMTWKCWDFHLGNRVICTLQLAVSCFNDDTYPLDKFLQPGLGDGFKALIPAISRAFAFYEPGEPLTNEQEELFFKFVAKESDSAHSYNGFIKSIKYGYGLKPLSKHFLNYEQATFAQTLGDKAHMGQLTGEEVASYGADDAWVCLHLYHKLMEYLLATNPQMVPTFFEQENPMTHIYAQTWAEGVVTNREAVAAQREVKRKDAAQLFRDMKATVRNLLPFPEDVHEKLVKYDPKGYGKEGNAQKYRNQVIAWANSPDSDDDLKQLMQTRTALSKQIAEELGIKESNGPSITYYQVVRCMLYDLCRCSFQLSDGKIQSDADSQQVMKERLEKKEETERSKEVLKLLQFFRGISDINQVIKLYINKYMNLIDPDTSRVYPVLSSQLNSHRMALEEPNLSQLPKGSNLAFVRGFFEPDNEDHVLISADWSAVELVLIGEQSGDPVFAKAYGQIPHDDLHSESATALLGLTLEEFKVHPDKKNLRNKLGKPANFGYFYSGALGTTAKDLGWSSEQMWEYVEAYRTKFQVAENWRVGVINKAKVDGYVDLPDGHRRYRFESSGLWASYMQDKFDQFGPALSRFGKLAIRKIQNRSGNQSVNSLIQGTCATLAKRSILNMDARLEYPASRRYNPKGFDARFKFPVHDELVYSVHKDHAVAFMRELREVMCSHPGIVDKLKLDVSIAVGKNFNAWHPENNPKGQIELDEASKVPCLPEDRWGKKLTDEERGVVVQWLTSQG